MNNITHCLAEIIKRKVLDSVRATDGERMECRFVFNGPPLILLEPVFEKLIQGGGIEVGMGNDGTPYLLPVLLQVPSGMLSGANPKIGASGRCDKDHLLDVRNSPNKPSFIALVPPSQTNSASITTSSEEFGIKSSVNVRGVPFEQWWGDDFIQQLISQCLRQAGFIENQEDATHLVEHAASALFDFDQNDEIQTSAWLLLSRVYSIVEYEGAHRAGTSLSLACGVPPLENGSISAKLQIATLERIADEMSGRFKTSVEHLKISLNEEHKSALDDFLQHVLMSCKVPSSFDRTVEAYYVPDRQASTIRHAPNWWSTLTAELWTKILADEPVIEADDLELSCINSLIPVLKGLPAIVHDEVKFELSLVSGKNQSRVDATLMGGSWKKIPLNVDIGSPLVVIDDLENSKLKAATSYKLDASGRKPVSAKIISLAHWEPGILVTSRVATKLTVPKRPSGRGLKVDWESSLVLPSPGRYELLIFLAVDVEVIKVDLEVEGNETLVSLDMREIRDQEMQFELEAESNCHLLLSYITQKKGVIQTLQVQITCDEVKVEGCRSEFEKLIRLNRNNIDRIAKKSVVQLDRTSRISSLQTWLIDEHAVAKSFIPIVLSDDYGPMWATPNWQLLHGPLFSKAKFLQDPRPRAELFVPPEGFIAVRSRIAQRIRECEDGIGLVEAAPLGKWCKDDPDFRADVEQYLRLYLEWLSANREVASWVDIIAVCPSVDGGNTLSSQPEAVILSPLHPLRLGWHCLAQQVLVTEVEIQGGIPCPAASILDAHCIPDMITMPIQSAAGLSGIEWIDFLSVESNSDYWGVLWNGSRLGNLPDRSRKAPFDQAFGILIGGLTSGFSTAQVGRALEDVSILLAAKPCISVAISSAGGSTDACNDGLIRWCIETYSDEQTKDVAGSIGPRFLKVYDNRPEASRPDQATIANLVEDTGNRVSWYHKLTENISPDLGIIAQLDSSEPRSSAVGQLSPLSFGALFRHRVRRQLNGTFLSESRQGVQVEASDDLLANMIVSAILALEGRTQDRTGLVFSPNVNSVTKMMENHHAEFVAVSSSAVDPACFLGGWGAGTYLWDYDLPSYSNRAGDTSGYYLLSQVREADKELLERVLTKLPGGAQFTGERIEALLHEVARRGIPTVRGLSGDDTGATGDLGLFIAVRLLQDDFRIENNTYGSLLPVLSGTQISSSIAIIIPVDPFREYLADIAKSLVKDRKELTLSRPDLLVFGITIEGAVVSIKVTPIEVKFRQGSTFSKVDSKEALDQAKSLAVLFATLSARAGKSDIWKLTFQHLLISMLSFGMRVYSQHKSIAHNAAKWASFHELACSALLMARPPLEIDHVGRLIVIDNSTDSGARDNDADGFAESIVISPNDASSIVCGDSANLFTKVREAVGDWGLLPDKFPHSAGNGSAYSPDIAHTNLNTLPITEIITSPAVTTEANPSVESPLISVSQSPELSEVLAPDCKKVEGIVLELGSTVDVFDPRVIHLNISDTRLNHMNTGVVGDLGTGKTQLLKSIISQISGAQDQNRGIKPRMLIFDYKKDYSEPSFVAALGAKVVKPHRLPLNLFDTSKIGDSLVPWMDRYKFFSDVLDKIFSGIGPVQRTNLKSAVKAAYETAKPQDKQPTIYDIYNEYQTLLNGRSDAPLGIIGDLVDMEIFEENPALTVPFDQFLDGVVIISLDSLGQDDRTKNMLVAIMLNMFYENMLRLPKRPFIGAEPQLRVIDSYLLVDEADNIMRYDFDVLRKLLLQGREFGVGVILASQYLKHFKTNANDYKDSLLTWFIHKVPNVSASEISGLGITSELSEIAERVKILPNHHCLFKSYGEQVEFIKGLPFFELVGRSSKNGIN